MIKQKNILCVLLYLLANFSLAQDTLKLTLQKADSLLIINNLSLIAEHYNIDIAKANIIQAKLFNNPELYFEGNLYNPKENRPLDIYRMAGGTSEKIIAISKTFRIAGQRNKEIQLAETATQMTEQQYYDLVRTLKYQLRQSFYGLLYLRKAVNSVDKQLALLDETLDAYKVQYEKGNVSLKDYTRLQATFFQLYNDRTALLHESYSCAKILKTLVATENPISVILSEKEISMYSLQKISPQRLQDSAFANRPDLKAMKLQIQYNEMNKKLQKSLAVPDLKIGVTYDQSGSYVNDYTGFTISSQLPFFNRNQGNIQMAEIAVKQSQMNLQQLELLIKNELTENYNQVMQIENEYQKTESSFQTQLEQMNKGLLENYTKNNISLLEFTDLFEAYNTSIIQLNVLRSQRISAYEELNYLTGTELFK